MLIAEEKLRGQYVYLQTLQPGDRDILKSLAHDARLWEYTKTLLLNDAFDAQWERYITTAFDDRATGGQHSFVIRQTSDNRIIGNK